jgi:hypothetical protein
MTEKRKPDYSKTVIYYIDVNGLQYYGHTVNVKNRKAIHKYDFKRHPDYPLYRYMHENKYDIHSIELVEVEKYPCKTIQEAKTRERWWIENHGDKELHRTTPGRSSKEFEIEYTKRRIELRKKRVAENPEKYKEKAKHHYQAHKEYESQRHKHYYQQKREFILETYKNNKDDLNKRRRERYAKNKDKINEKRRAKNAQQ